MTNHKVLQEVRDGIEIFKLEDATGATAEIAPQLGNNCFAFHTDAPILESVSFEEFRARPTSYGIPLLFPFPNRIRDGTFTFQGESFKVNPPRHGLVRDKAWRVLSSGASDKDGAWIRSQLKSLDYPEEIFSQFPFPFVIEVTYRLKDGTLHLEATAQNTGEREMPLGFGIHPYFERPARGSLQVPAAQKWELEDSLPTGRLLAVGGDDDLREPKEIENLVLDDIFADLTMSDYETVRCYLNDEAERRQTVIEFSAQEFPYVVVYTPPAPRHAICIEPNSCPTDAFNLSARGIECNMQVLRPGESASFTTRFYSRKIN